MRFLFIYPNHKGMTMLPPGIALLSACLKKEGHKVKLFETTLYNKIEYNNKIIVKDADLEKAEKLNVRPIKKSSYPLIKGLELESFKIQLDYLEKNYKIIAMESLINFAKNSAQLPDSPCLLTFDDGYKDHYLYVFPELKKRGIQGSFFSVAKTVLEKKILDLYQTPFLYLISN